MNFDLDFHRVQTNYSRTFLKEQVTCSFLKEKITLIGKNCQIKILNQKRRKEFATPSMNMIRMTV